MDWDNAADRARLIESVGPTEYNRLQAEYISASTVATVNGYRIRPVNSRFGLLFMIDGAGVAYATLERAEDEASKLPTYQPQEKEA